MTSVAGASSRTRRSRVSPSISGSRTSQMTTSMGCRQRQQGQTFGPVAWVNLVAGVAQRFGHRRPQIGFVVNEQDLRARTSRELPPQ